MVVKAIIIGILLAAVPAWSASWDEINTGLKEDIKANKPTEAQGLTSLLIPPNAKKAQLLATLYKAYEKQFREACAPEYRLQMGASNLPMYKEALQAYKDGRLTYIDAVMAAERVKAQSNGENGGRGWIQEIVIANITGDPKAIAQQESAQRAQFLAGLYPGSSVSCFEGRGMLAWTPDAAVTYKEGKVWRFEQTDGMVKTTITSIPGGYEIVIDSAQRLSAAAVLMLPGHQVQNENLEVALADYRHKLKEAQGSRGVSSDGWYSDILRQHRSGATENEIKKSLQDRAAANLEALPEAYNVWLQGQSQDFAAISRRLEEHNTTTNDVKDTGYKIVALHLDSAREATLAEKDASVRMNELIKNAETIYLKVADFTDVVSFLDLVLREPTLRQQIAK